MMGRPFPEDVQKRIFTFVSLDTWPDVVNAAANHPLAHRRMQRQFDAHQCLYYIDNISSAVVRASILAHPNKATGGGPSIGACNSLQRGSPSTTTTGQRGRTATCTFLVKHGPYRRRMVISLFDPTARPRQCFFTTGAPHTHVMALHSASLFPSWTVTVPDLGALPWGGRTGSPSCYASERRTPPSIAPSLPSGEHDLNIKSQSKPQGHVDGSAAESLGTTLGVVVVVFFASLLRESTGM